MKTDIDFNAGLLSVARSHDRDTTKGGSEEVIPIAEQLIPYLRIAVEASDSELVFPNWNGERRREDMKLAKTLRRALGRAGIVKHYKHVCRRSGCGYEEVARDSDLRRCTRCDM